MTELIYWIAGALYLMAGAFTYGSALKVRPGRTTLWEDFLGIVIFMLLWPIAAAIAWGYNSDSDKS